MKFTPMKAIVVNLRELRKVTQYPPLLRLQMGGPVQKEKPHLLSMGSFCLYNSQQDSHCFRILLRIICLFCSKIQVKLTRGFFLVDSLYRLLAGCLTLM